MALLMSDTPKGQTLSSVTQEGKEVTVNRTQHRKRDDNAELKHIRSPNMV